MPIGLLIVIAIFAAVIWSAIWKGWALWVAGNRKEKAWFVVLFVVNTLGILDIIYIFTRKENKRKRKN